MSDFNPWAEDWEERARLALEDIREGRIVILTDDEDRENEGDLVIAAEKITPEAINFMARHGRGLICLSLTTERARELQLSPMVPENTSRYETAFTVSIEARDGVSTGISVSDRARTITVAIDPQTKPDDLARPGHIFPLRARPGGVLERAGQTEGSVDLARLAGLNPSGVICEVMNEDGSMARMVDLIEFGRTHTIHICTVEDLIRFRLQNERLVKRVFDSTLPTRRGLARVSLYGSDVSDQLHMVIVPEGLDMEGPVPVRAHMCSVLEDVFGAIGGENTVRLENVLDFIFDDTHPGVVLYLYAGGLGPRDLHRHLEAYQYHQVHDVSMIEAMTRLNIRRDPKDFGIGAQILAAVGLGDIKLISNSPYKLRGLEGYGLRVVDYIKIPPLEGERKEA